MYLCASPLLLLVDVYKVIKCIFAGACYSFCSCQPGFALYLASQLCSALLLLSTYGPFVCGIFSCNFAKKVTPTPQLTLLLVLLKSSVNQKLQGWISESLIIHVILQFDVVWYEWFKDSRCLFFIDLLISYWVLTIEPPKGTQIWISPDEIKLEIPQTKLLLIHTIVIVFLFFSRWPL